MMNEVKTLLKERGKLSLRELAVHFEMDPGALEPMLDVLVRKRRVRVERLGCGKTCAGCTEASRLDMTLYELEEAHPC